MPSAEDFSAFRIPYVRPSLHSDVRDCVITAESAYARKKGKVPENPHLTGRDHAMQMSRDSGSVGLSWSVVTNSTWSIIGSYDAILNQDLVQHIGSITMNFAW